MPSVRAIISNDLKKCRATIRAWFLSFFVDFSQHAGIYYTDSNGNKRIIRNFRELEYVSKNFKTREELIEYYKMLYFPFDYMPDYIHDIRMNLMIQHKLNFDPELIEEKTNDNRMANGATCTKKNCFDKIVSVILNEIRGKLKDKMKALYKLEFSLKNLTVDDSVDKNVKRHLHRKHRMLHTFMLIGEFVSEKQVGHITIYF